MCAFQAQPPLCSFVPSIFLARRLELGDGGCIFEEPVLACESACRRRREKNIAVILRVSRYPTSSTLRLRFLPSSANVEVNSLNRRDRHLFLAAPPIQELPAGCFLCRFFLPLERIGHGQTKRRVCLRHCMPSSADRPRLSMACVGSTPSNITFPGWKRARKS